MITLAVDIERQSCWMEQILDIPSNEFVHNAIAIGKTDWSSSN
jgi:hypothetical protein